MVRRKITKKTPKDTIKHKTPVDKIQQKQPKDSEDPQASFILPPHRNAIKQKLPKSDVHLPTDYGSHDSTKSKVNIPPPFDTDEKKPSNSFKKPMRSRLKNRKEEFSNITPPKFKTRLNARPVRPTRKGVLQKGIRKKSPKDKTLPKNIERKSPPKTRLPPPIIKTDEDIQKKVIDKKLPQEIISKTPSTRKKKPPPTVEESIPKKRIRKKKPR
ncbi:MAG: hypothetical protein ACFFCQ_16535 [Promethearchaeota archaeon]